MKRLQSDLRNKREFLEKLIDQQREEFAFNSRPLRETSDRIEIIGQRIRNVIAPLSYLVLAVSFLKTKVLWRHPATVIKKFQLLTMLMGKGSKLLSSRNR